MKKKFFGIFCKLVVLVAIFGLNQGKGEAVPPESDPEERALEDREEPTGVPEVTATARVAPEEGEDESEREDVKTDEKSPQTYVMRLRSLSENISTLKERVSQTKYRLSLLKEAVLHGTIAGAQLQVIQEHRMGTSFRLTSIRYALDGKGIFGREGMEEVKRSDLKEMPIFSGPIPPGPHVLTVELKWRGHGHHVFSYLRGYEFRVLSSHSFRATEGTETVIRVRAYEKGNISTPLKDRPAVRFIQQTRVVQPQRKVEGEEGKASR